MGGGPFEVEKGRRTDIRMVGSAATFRLETIGGTIVEFRVPASEAVTLTAGEDIRSVDLTINEGDVVQPRAIRIID